MLPGLARLLAELMVNSRAARISVVVFFLLVLGAIGAAIYTAGGPATQ